MRVKRGPIWALTATRHLVGERVAVLLLIAVGLALVVFSKIHEEEAAQFRMAVADTLAPVYEVVSQPIQTSNRMIDEAATFLNTYEQNKILKLQVERLQQWRNVALSLEQTNVALSKQLNLKLKAQPSYVTGRVIGDAIGPYVKTYIVNVGRGDGVKKGQAVISGGNVVGRVTTTGNRAARVLLLTDLNSRIPVIIEGTRVRGILAGDNSDTAQLRFLPANAGVEIGARIVTSGHGGVFPPGLAIGEVTSLGANNIRVRPLAEINGLEYATVLQSFAGSGEFDPMPAGLPDFVVP